MTNLDYLYNKDADENYFDINRFSDETLGFKVIEGGTIIPNKREKLFSDWWGTGGIFDSQDKFVEDSATQPTQRFVASLQSYLDLGENS